MRVFVSQQVAVCHPFVPLRQIVGAQPVFARLMMFEPNGPDRIAQRKQKIVMSIVMRSEELLGLYGQVLVQLKQLRAHLHALRSVAKNIQVDYVVRACRQVDAIQVRASIQGRIDECVQWNPFKLHPIGFLRIRLESGCELPSFGNHHCRVELNSSREVAGRVENRIRPLEVQQLLGRGNPAL